MNKIILNGITWAHSRGITPLLAAGQRFSELYPQVEINWQKRTLQEFADYPIEKLTAQYDLLIIDHPWVGCAAATACVLPLEAYLPEEFLENQLENTVGGSHLSYHYKGHQWALAIDAATPVASYRADLFEKNDMRVPDTWQEVISLAKKGKLAVPSIPIDLLMAFYMFCIANGSEPFLNDEEIIDLETGLKALDSMKELWSLVDEKMFACNPVDIAEMMSSTDDYLYCPFAYGYSNYSRKGYAKYLLTYSDLPLFKTGSYLRSTLGGTGLGISSFASNKEWAIRFAAWIVSAEIQSTLYVQHGGQPGHRSAWINEEVNDYCNHYFINTLGALDRSYVRPRYNGYLCFQDHAGISLQKYLQGEKAAEKVLEKMNELYRCSKRER